MSRLYRLRGLAMRALRAMLLLKLLNRLFRVAPDKQLRRLREELREREADIRFLKHQIAELERMIAAKKAAEAVETGTPHDASCSLPIVANVELTPPWDSTIYFRF